MASDEQQFKRYARKWERLRERQEYSLAPELGYTAVIYSHAAKVLSEDESHFEQIEYTAFANEARQIADTIAAQNGKAFIIKGLTHEAFEEGVIRNREVSDVVVIGHGTFSSVYCDDGDILDWRHIADMTVHLKAGYIEQRFCGNYRRNLSVPFGLFAVQSARRLFAPKGMWFSPETRPEHESRIGPITLSDRLSLKQIREMFPQQVELETP